MVEVVRIRDPIPKHLRSRDSLPSLAELQQLQPVAVGVLDVADDAAGGKLGGGVHGPCDALCWGSTDTGKGNTFSSSQDLRVRKLDTRPELSIEIQG